MSSSARAIVCIVVFCYNLGLVHSSLCCLDGWTSFNGSCYFFGHHDLDFQEAERFCAHYKAHLTSIETQNENTFIKSHLQNYKDPRHWIGLTDEIVENAWVWYENDKPATFTDWGSRQPDQGRTANCVAIWASYKYQWVDEPCTHLFKPLCEMKANVEVEVVGK
ncbi:C-type lectin mannose-binding isoform-like [Mercenaria mercenaria]|uniref:C-type lectin mannose-binding isoform-like n=1 Tax=Mercenaria mercenaria TaxID=6596 RepID=UPI00234F0D69|nr:C-type lectin mannose-binding isoform-like [Mercenaria mercenaria]